MVRDVSRSAYLLSIRSSRKGMNLPNPNRPTDGPRRRKAVVAYLRGNPSVGSLAASLLGQATLVVSGPASARLLGVSGRGEFALLLIVAVLASQLGAAGVPAATAFTLASNGEPARGLIARIAAAFSWQCAVAATATIAAVVLIVGDHTPLLIWLEASLTAIWVATSMIWQLIMGCLQGEQRYKAMNSLRSTPALATAVGLGTCYLVTRHTGVLTILSITVIATVTTCAIAIWVFVSGAPAASRSPTSYRTLLRYGVRSIAGTSAPLESFSIDQALVGLLLTRRDLGLYAVASSFNNFPSIITAGLGTIAFPRIAAERSTPNKLRLLRVAAAEAIALAAATTIATEAVVGFVLPIAFGEAYAPATQAARILILAGFLFAVRRTLVAFLNAIARPGSGSVGEAISLVVLGLCAIALVPPMKLTGAALALLLAALIGDLYLAVMLRRALSRLAQG